MKNVYVDRSPIHGKGVFAAVDINEGAIILEIDDTRVVTRETPLRPEKGEYEQHCDYLENGKVVLMQEPERYINHCCDPNVHIKQIADKRYVRVMRPIKAGEEITFDYCINSLGDTVWQCNCPSANCRKTIHSNFFHLPLEKQREYLPYLADWFIEENKEKIVALTSHI